MKVSTPIAKCEIKSHEIAAKITELASPLNQEEINKLLLENNSKNFPLLISELLTEGAALFFQKENDKKEDSSQTEDQKQKLSVFIQDLNSIHEESELNSVEPLRKRRKRQPLSEPRNKKQSAAENQPQNLLQPQLQSKLLNPMQIQVIQKELTRNEKYNVEMERMVVKYITQYPQLTDKLGNLKLYLELLIMETRVFLSTFQNAHSLQSILEKLSFLKKKQGTLCNDIAKINEELKIWHAAEASKNAIQVAEADQVLIAPEIEAAADAPSSADQAGPLPVVHAAQPLANLEARPAQQKASSPRLFNFSNNLRQDAKSNTDYDPESNLLLNYKCNILTHLSDLAKREQKDNPKFSQALISLIGKVSNSADIDTVIGLCSTTYKKIKIFCRQQEVWTDLEKFFMNQHKEIESSYNMIYNVISL